MILLWAILIVGFASCENDFDMKKYAEDFLDDLTSNNSEKAQDHSHHNHAGHDAHAVMDHSAHNHGASGGGHDHGGHMMKMWFHGGFEEVILFDFWRIESLTGLLVSCILIFVMGAAYEGLKWFRVYLQVCSSQQLNQEIPLAVTGKSGCHHANGAADPLVVSKKPRRKLNNAFSLPRLTQAALYIIQLVLAYWLMLIVMTYNSWLSIAVVLGAGFGHWLFAVLQIENPQGQAADSFATDACH